MNEHSLTFLPFLKRQPSLPISISEAGQISATLNLSVKDNNGMEHAATTQSLTLRGPGDVLGISQSAIARLEPPPQTDDFEPNYFPYIEFVDADFCWRYSLDTLVSNSRIAHPWLTLIVLSISEMDGMTNDGIEVLSLFEDRRQFLSVKGQFLPNLSDAKYTAHVHLSNHQNPLADYIENQSSKHCSRLFCFRKLSPETSYMAFLVPTYKIAVQAAFGLGQNDAGTAKAWLDPAPDDIIKLPVYYSWSFTTSESGDFEQLARNLKPTAIAKEDQVGTRAVDANLIAPKTEPKNDRFFLREGALAAPGFSDRRQGYTDQSESLPMPTPMLDALNESLKPSTAASNEIEDVDPLITLTAYGRYFRKTSKLIPPENDQWLNTSPWIHELNLDFRNRVASAFGTAGVQNNQDEYMKACWSQVGEIRKANEKLRLTKAAYIISKVIDKKHFKPLTNERFALIATPFHGHFTGTDKDTSISVKQQLAQSGISRGVYSASFKRIANRQIGIKLVEPVKGIGQTERGFHPRPLKKQTFAPTGVPPILSDVMNKLPGAGVTNLTSKKEVIPVKPVDISDRFRIKFNIETVLKNKMSGSIKTNEGQSVPADFDPILAYPKINVPMYSALKDLSSDYLLPGIENIENNGVTLCEENRRFIESYMVGLNHEMGRELVWQNYPTHKRGTIFSHFWDQITSKSPPVDIKEIHKWTNKLGDNKEGFEIKNLVLVIKGDLIRRYPGTIVYLIKTDTKEQYWSDEYSQGDPPMDSTHKFDPVLRAQVGQDILCVGFPLDLKDIQGPQRNGEYYFVLQENHDLPRFGLDVSSKRIKDSPGCEEIDVNDLSWSDATLDSAGYITNFEQAPFAASVTNSPTSATIASKTYQLPIRVAIHASELLEKIE